MNENEREIRRKLIKTAVYVHPAILGVMMAKPSELEVATVGATKNCKGGGAIIVSANGNACCPCLPGILNIIQTNAKKSVASLVIALPVGARYSNHLKIVKRIRLRDAAPVSQLAMERRRRRNSSVFDITP